MNTHQKEGNVPSAPDQWKPQQSSYTWTEGWKLNRKAAETFSVWKLLSKKNGQIQVCTSTRGNWKHNKRYNSNIHRKSNVWLVDGSTYWIDINRYTYIHRYTYINRYKDRLDLIRTHVQHKYFDTFSGSADHSLLSPRRYWPNSCHQLFQLHLTGSWGAFSRSYVQSTVTTRTNTTLFKDKNLKDNKKVFTMYNIIMRATRRGAG